MNIVSFKGTQDGIIVNIKNDSSFEDILFDLKAKLKKSKDFFAGEKTNISISANNLTTEEENEILKVIEDIANLEINFIGNNFYFKNKTTTISKNNDGSAILDNYNSTYFHTGTLRSGDSIKYDGSVVLLGGTNPGSEIIATGNIIVQGSIKGLVHAGSKGNTNCYISAYNLSPIQLRIADIITFIPNDIINENKDNAIPRYAYINDNKIYISKI